MRLKRSYVDFEGTFSGVTLGLVAQAETSMDLHDPPERRHIMIDFQGPTSVQTDS